MIYFHQKCIHFLGNFMWSENYFHFKSVSNTKTRFDHFTVKLRKGSHVIEGLGRLRNCSDMWMNESTEHSKRGFLKQDHGRKMYRVGEKAIHDTNTRYFSVHQQNSVEQSYPTGSLPMRWTKISLWPTPYILTLIFQWLRYSPELFVWQILRAR